MNNKKFQNIRQNFFFNKKTKLKIFQIKFLFSKIILKIIKCITKNKIIFDYIIFQK